MQVGACRALAVGNDHDLAVVLQAAFGRQLVIKEKFNVADVDPVSRSQSMVRAREELAVIDLGLVP